MAALFSSVLASSLSGCCPIAGCGCGGDPTVGTRVVEALATEVEAASPDAQGVIAVENCEQLCQATGIGEDVLSCKDVGPVEDLGMAGAGAEERREVECVVEVSPYCEGRRHAAVASEFVVRGPSEVAAWLSRMASAEAASVPAFVALRDELRAHGAPDELVARAEAAAADEVRHTQTIRSFAERAGAEPVRGYPRQQTCRRSLFELAIENAVEGCVHEAFSGLVALHQARCAADAEFRQAMATVADEEIGHGELAWAIHAWACSQLSDAEVEAVGHAMREAAQALVVALGADKLAPATRAALGLPAPQQSAAMADALRERLWS